MTTTQNDHSALNLSHAPGISQDMCAMGRGISDWPPEVLEGLRRVVHVDFGDALKAMADGLGASHANGNLAHAAVDGAKAGAEGVLKQLPAEIEAWPEHGAVQVTPAHGHEPAIDATPDHGADAGSGHGDQPLHHADVHADH